MKKIFIIVFSVMVLASLGGWAQTGSQKSKKAQLQFSEGHEDDRYGEQRRQDVYR